MGELLYVCLSYMFDDINLTHEGIIMKLLFVFGNLYYRWTLEMWDTVVCYLADMDLLSSGLKVG